MSTTYYIIPKYASGAVAQWIVSDYSSLTYSSEVNNVGLGSITLRDTHPACSVFYSDKAQIEVWRQNAQYGMLATKVWSGFARSDVTQFDRSGHATFYFEDFNSLLRRALVAYYAGVDNRSEFTSLPAETIMKTLVNYNIGPAALAANGRFISNVIPQVSINTDLGRGATKSWSTEPSENLLEVLQKLVAAGAGGDFLVQDFNASSWRFEFYPGQLGTNRTSSVVFALGRGNMDKPRRQSNRSAEKTVAIVGGEGKGLDLVFVTRTGANYSLPVNNPPNHQEMWVSGGGYKSIPALQAIGDRALDESRARRKFSFQPMQTLGSFWGVHYFLGDLVTADIFGTSTTHKINKVSVSHVGSESAEGGGDEKVTVECVEV
jgi:hypothetical protein